MNAGQLAALIAAGSVAVLACLAVFVGAATYRPADKMGTRS